MSPHSKESRLIRTALQKAFPQASREAMKSACLAAAYGASPKQLARIMVEDAKKNAEVVNVK